MSGKPRLLILTSSYPGSVADQTCAYIRHFAEQLAAECEVTVLTPISRGALREEHQAAVRVVRFHYLWPRRLERLESTTDTWGILRTGWLAKVAVVFYLVHFLVRAFSLGCQSDLIVSHWLVPSGLIGGCLAQCLGKRHVVIEHSGALRFLKRIPYGQRVLRCILKRARRVVTVSEDLRRQIVELAPEFKEKMEVIPMGVHPDHSSRASMLRQDRIYRSGDRVVLFLGRLAEVKGIPTLIHAMAGIEGAVLVVAGDGEEKGRLETLARAQLINALFLGRIGSGRKQAWLNRADVVVVPSVRLANGRTEGIPVVCLEAMAAGKPIIASRVGGIPELIRDRRNGLLVEPGQVVELRAAIRRVLDDELLRSRLSIEAQRTARDYQWPVIGQRFLRVIKDVLHE